MNINWKVSAVFAGAAFVLAFLSGAIAGVGFGVLFLRALLGAFVFAVVGGGASFVINRFLPELKALAGKDSPDAAENTDGASAGTRRPGDNIDIVVEGEELASPLPASDEGGAGDEELVEYVEESGTGPDADEPDSDESGEPVFSPELAGEPENLDEAPPRRPGRPAGRSSDDLVDEVEEAGGEERESLVEDLGEESEDLLREGVDHLPEMEGLSSRFGSDDNGDGVQEMEGQKSGPDPIDPETMARALRTVLKRDKS